MVTVEVIGIDHVYVAVHLRRVLRPRGVLGFRKRATPMGGDPHLHYYNRYVARSLRPAREREPPTTTRMRPGCTSSASGL